MTNYFCFSCKKYFVSESVLKKHAIYANHAQHEIGMNLNVLKISNDTRQCPCGEMFQSDELLEQHFSQMKCLERVQQNTEKQQCQCGSTEVKVFCKQGESYYQCNQCMKRCSFKSSGDMHSIENDITMRITNDHQNDGSNSDTIQITSKSDLMGQLKNPYSTIIVAKQLGLLMETPVCGVCHQNMVLCRRNDRSDCYVYSCYK